MTKIISIIVVLVLVVLAIVSLNARNSALNNTQPVQTTASSTQAIALKDVTVPDGMYTVNPNDIKITWAGRKVVLKNWVDSGTVALKEGSFEIKNNAVVSNKFVIDMNSIVNVTNGMGKNQEMMQNHLKSDAFFDVAKFPTATFVAKKFIDTTPQNIDKNTLEMMKSKTFTIVGDMTIKGATNEISIPVTFKKETDAKITAHGSVDLDRTKWDIRYASTKFFENLGDKVIDDMFNIAFDITLNIASSTTK